MNSGRAALLIHALTTSPEFLLPGTEDYLHQSYRAEAMRPSAELIARCAGQGTPPSYPAPDPPCWSWPTAKRKRREVVDFIGAHTAGNTPEVGWRVMKLAVDVEGAKVEVHRR